MKKSANKPITSQPFLPWELIDEILIEMGNSRLAVILERFSIVRRIDEIADSHWAIFHRRLKYLKYLNERGLCDSEYWNYVLNKCARINWIDILKYCHEKIAPITRRFGYVFDQAVSRGHIDLIKYLHSIRSRCTERAMDGAAEHGRLEIVKWIHFNRNEGCTTMAMNTAAARGRLEMVKWLHLNRKEGCTLLGFKDADFAGFHDVLEYLYHNRSDLLENQSDIAEAEIQLARRFPDPKG